MKKILFSPIGGTDPIANERDGSLLHMCRIYRPDKVFLFLSKEIFELHKKDNRYLYCLEKLGDLLEHKFEYELIIEKELSEVQDYNYFYKRFRDIVKNIVNDMEEDDILYLNTSSGTPAMKSALQVMSAITEYPFVPIQVKTPERGMNPKLEDRFNYEPDIQWECNLDNEASDLKNRCEEVKCENLILLLKLDLIRKFISVYDYKAARIVADEIRRDLSDESYNLIAAAEARLQLDKSGVSKYLKQCTDHIIPVQSGNQREIIEYLLALDIKLKKGEYADFLRGITPVTADLFELILEKRCAFTVRDYIERKYSGQEKWRTEILEKNERAWRILQDAYREGFKGGNISSDHMMYLIMGLSEDQELKRFVRDLREVEMAVRNTAAHEVVSITEKWVKEKTKKTEYESLKNGLTPEQIFKIMKRLCHYAGLPSGENVWKSYSEMNRRIKESLKIGI